MIIFGYRPYKDIEGNAVILFRRRLPRWFLQRQISRGFGLYYWPTEKASRTTIQKRLEEIFNLAGEVISFSFASNLSYGMGNIRKLAKLRTLTIAAPMAWKMDLSKCVELRSLNILDGATRYVEGLDRLRNLNQCRVAKPTGNFLRNLPPNVKHLEIYGSAKNFGFSDIPEQLEKLSLQRLKGHDLADLPHMANLISLQLEKFYEVANLHAIRHKAPNLKFLELGRVLLTDQAVLAKAVGPQVQVIQSLTADGEKEFLELLAKPSSS